MGKIKLLLLPLFFVGSFAFAQCGPTITGGAGSTQQTNTYSNCPSNANLSAFSGGGSIPNLSYNFGPGYAKAKAEEAKASTCGKSVGEATYKKATCKSGANTSYLAELNNCGSETRELAAIPSTLESETQPYITCKDRAETKNIILKENCDLDFEADLSRLPLYCNKDGTVKKE